MLTPDQFGAACRVYCLRMSCSVTSGFRTLLRNQEIGGKDDSWHLIGLAKDVVYDHGLPDRDVAMKVARPLGLFVYVAAGYKHHHLRPLKDGE